MKKTKSNKTFLSELIEKFPEVETEVMDSDYKGLISLQIGCFRRYTQNAINNNDLITVKKFFDFIDNNFDLVSSTTNNSFVVSFLGKLNLSENRDAEQFLSGKLRDKLLSLKSYYDSFATDKRLNDFLENL